MNPLEQLKDVHVPESVSWWPIAFGWWLLIGLFIVSFVVLTIWLIRRARKRAVLKAALDELDRITPTENNWQSTFNSLLKRAALGYYPTEVIAQLHGEKWLDFLTKQLPEGKQTEFNQLFSILLESIYRRSSTDKQPDFGQIKQQTRLWLVTALPPKKLNLEASHV